jgi:hypothetical protein
VSVRSKGNHEGAKKAKGAKAFRVLRDFPPRSHGSPDSVADGIDSKTRQASENPTGLSGCPSTRVAMGCPLTQN